MPEPPQTRATGDSPSSRVGRYRLEREIGSGGMGVVYAAFDPHLDRAVAIKLLSPERRGAGAQAGLLREAQTMARLSHPNIAAVHDVGVHGESVFIAMEYIDGADLREWAARPGRSWPELWSAFRQAGLGLAAAHAAGVVHRDFKPDNAIVDRSGRVRVVDFGLAGQADAAGDGRLRGTPGYVAPEQRAGAPADARADQYSFCVALREVLEGDPAMFAGLPRGFRDALARGAGADPADRFADMTALLEALDDDSGNPFLGLLAFSEADASRFFGRRRDTEAALELFADRGLLALVGPSGVGKSSLLFAGVIAGLRDAEPDLDVVALRPGSAPTAALEQLAPAAHPILVIDQLEEVFRAAEDEQLRFFAALDRLAGGPEPPRIALTMRSDYLDRVAAIDRGFMRRLTAGLFFVPPIGTAGLRDALVEPVHQAGYAFESPEMIDHVIERAGDPRSALPLLQFMGSRLWQGRDREQRTLTRAHYDDLGGIEGTLANHADATLVGLERGRQDLARRIFERLVTPELTRDTVELGELAEMAPRSASEIIEHFAAARLLTVREIEGGPVVVELAHESLIERWPTLRRWVEDRADDAEILGRLRHAARVWRASERDVGALWRDEMADEAIRARGRFGDDLGALEREYLDALVGFRRRDGRRRRAKLLAGFALLGLTAIVTSALAYRSWMASNHATAAGARASEEADRATAEATRARDATRVAVGTASRADPTTALAFLREVEDPMRARGWPELVREIAVREIADWAIDEKPGAIVASRWVSGVPHWLVASGGELRLHRGDARPIALEAPAAGLYSAAIGPRGRLVALVEPEGTIQLIPIAGDRAGPRRRLDHPSPVLFVDFRADGRMLASASRDGSARVWDIDRPGPPLVLAGHHGWVTAAVFGPDGRQLATSSYDGSARLWRGERFSESIRLTGHRDRLNSVAFSPDGTRVVTASFDGTAAVWAAAGPERGKRLKVLAGHDDWVFRAAFAPDGERVITASADRTARVWRVDGLAAPIVLRGHADWLYGAAFAPDGRRALTWSKDGSARLWHIGRGVARVLEHRDQVADAAFDPGGDRVLTRSIDGTLRTWRVRVDRQAVPLTSTAARSIAVAPGGDRYALAIGDRAEIWDREGRDPPVSLSGHQGPVWAVAFSADGASVATGSADGTAAIWDARTGARRRVLEGHGATVTWVRFSPDGRVVTASHDRTARIWPAGGGAPVVLSGHSDWINAVEVSPDGAAIATFSHDGTVRLWPAAGGESRVLYRGGTRILRGAFAPDGAAIAFGSADRTIRLLRLATGEPIAVLRGHTDSVMGLAFTPDGRRLVSGSSDHSIRLWNLEDRTSIRLGAHTDQVETVAVTPDGRHVASAAGDRAMLWALPTDPSPAAGLWSRTRYCPDVELRRTRLGDDAATARAALASCRARVSESAPDRSRRPSSAGESGPASSRAPGQRR